MRLTVTENRAPGRSFGRDDLNLGPLTYVTLCGALSSLIQVTFWPILALIAGGLNARLRMTICTVRSGGTVDGAAAVVTLDDDPVPDPQPANSDPSATAADSHAAMFRMMRRDAACNWPRVPNDSVPTLTETPTLSGAVQSPACRATVPAGRAAARKDVENQGAGRHDTDDTLERAADRAVGAARVDTPGKKAGVDVPRLRALQRHRTGALPAGPACESRHAARTSATLASIATDQDFVQPPGG